jgi:hypothetical protein
VGEVIARVFPRKTEATPNDEWVFFTEPPLVGYDYSGIEEIHVSCSFTYDRGTAEWLAKQWEVLGIPVKVGGPAYGDITTDFIPGRYLEKGITITSTGCPNKCWFCNVWRRVGGIRELDIKDGYIIQDDNLLACSEGHIKAVFDMLKNQKPRPEFKGGLEAKLLKPWHVELLAKSNPKSLFFAYDTPDDYEPLIEAGKQLREAGIDVYSRVPYAYVLMGYPKDTKEAAEQRCIDTLKAGFIPFGMLYKDEKGHEQYGWKPFQRRWTRPAIIYSRHKEYFSRTPEPV